MSCNLAIKLTDEGAHHHAGRHLHLAAYFYSATTRKPATLDLMRINDVSGGRFMVEEGIPVANKREARKVAADRGYQCWNF